MYKLYQFVLLKQLNYLLIAFLFCSNILLASNAELRLGVVGGFNNFNPYGIIGVTPKDYFLLSYDSLMIEPLDDLGNFKPLIAEKYKIQGNNITFYINKKSPLKAKDVIYTFNSIKKHGLPYYKQKLNDVDEITSPNELEVSFKLKEFSQSLFNLIVSLSIISENTWEQEDFLSPNLKIPATSGAYFIDSFSAGEEVVFKKNLNYWGADLPSRAGYFKFNTISYKYVATPMQLNLLYKSGEINFKLKDPRYKLSVDDKVFVQNNKYVPTFKAYFINIENAQLNVKLRQAISLAYNFNLVKDYFLSSNQQRLQSLFEHTPFKDDSFSFSNTPNLELAKELLKQERGIKLRFLFKSTEDFKISQDFINNLKKLGFDVSYKIPDFYTYLNLRKNRDYDIIVEELLFSTPPQDELISYFTKGGEYNYSGVEFNASNFKNLKSLDLQLKKLYVYIPLYYNSTTEYIYKNELCFNPQDTLDILKWWACNA